MKRSPHAAIITPLSIIMLVLFLLVAIVGNKAITVISENAPVTMRHCVIIDAGHGGIDGGATSCTGVSESKLNLDVAIRTNDLLHLLGIHTKMIRTEDISIYKSGKTIAAQKISDLKERVKIINSTENSVLLSIHMNYFPNPKYRGPQVFYAAVPESRELAIIMQKSLNSIDPINMRDIKKATDIYLMKHIVRPGILIECGFISNPNEEKMLRDPEYQKLLSCVICTSTATYIYNT
jgi:N-acetylmuramoyl-L-alanine amidase